MSGLPSDNFADDRPDPLSGVRDAVRMPATLLILAGILSLLLAILGLAQVSSFPEIMDQMIAATQANPNAPKQDKDNQIDMFIMIKDMAEDRTAFYTYYCLGIAYSLLVIVGGINMIRLSGPVTPTLSAILVMLPCVLGTCCFMGMPVGIWALVVLSRPNVQRALNRNSSADDKMEPGDR